MANTYLTPDVIAKTALVFAKNEATALKTVDQQHSKEFSNKVGDSIRIRKRVRYAASNGADVTGNINDTIEGSTLLQLSQRKSVAIQVSSQELTLDIKDFSEQHTKPAMIELIQQVESDITALYKQVWQFTGTAGTGLSTYADINKPREILDLAGVPIDDNRTGLLDPTAVTSLSNELKNVFQNEKVTTALERTRVGFYAWFHTYQNVSLQTHTVGDYAGTPLVNGASQNVTYDSVKDTNTQNLITDGWSFSIVTLLTEGDVFNIDGVNSVNPKTRADTGRLQDFVVRSVASSDGAGNSTLSISPAIIDSGPYQSVTAAPADNAAITVVTGAASSSHKQNLFYHKDAFTLAFAKLEKPLGNTESSSQTMDGVSVRVAMDYDGLTDQSIVRYDVLYGVLAQNPAFAARYTQQPYLRADRGSPLEAHFTSANSTQAPTMQYEEALEKEKKGLKTSYRTYLYKFIEGKITNKVVQALVAEQEIEDGWHMSIVDAMPKEKLQEHAKKAGVHEDTLSTHAQRQEVTMNRLLNYKEIDDPETLKEIAQQFEDKDGESLLAKVNWSEAGRRTIKHVRRDLKRELVAIGIEVNQEPLWQLPEKF